MLQAVKNWFGSLGKKAPPVIQEVPIVDVDMPAKLYFVDHLATVKEIWAVESKTQPNLWFIRQTEDKPWSQVFLDGSLYKTPAEAIDAERAKLYEQMELIDKRLLVLKELNTNPSN